MPALPPPRTKTVAWNASMLGRTTASPHLKVVNGDLKTATLNVQQNTFYNKLFDTRKQEFYTSSTVVPKLCRRASYPLFQVQPSWISQDPRWRQLAEPGRRGYGGTITQ